MKSMTRIVIHPASLRHELWLTVGALLLSVTPDGYSIVVHALTDYSEPVSGPRVVYTYGPFAAVTEEQLVFLGTVTLLGGAVYHVFEKVA